MVEVAGVEVRVFDPPLCCASGVCGPSVDPALSEAAADFAWLKAQGTSVTRVNLAQEPEGGDQVAHAGLTAPGGLDEADQLQPGGVGDRPEHGGERLGC